MWPLRPIASYSPMGSPRAGATCRCPPDVKYRHTHTQIYLTLPSLYTLYDPKNPPHVPNLPLPHVSIFEEATMPISSLFFGNLVLILARLLHHLRNRFAPRSISSEPPDQSNIETRQEVIATRQLANFVDSTISGTTLRNTSFVSCTLNRVEIYGSIISDSTLINCQLSNCTIDYSSVTDSKLHETKIFDSSMDNCTMTLSPLALRKFPPEVRAMIFEDCLDLDN